MNEELDPERLRQLAEAVSRLPREVQPERDAWPAIRDRIDAGRVRAIAPGGTSRDTAPARRFFWFAAAAVLLVAASSALTTWVIRQRGSALVAAPQNAGDPPAAAGQPATLPATTPDGGQPTTTAAGAPRVRHVVAPSVDDVFARYDAAANDLAEALRDRRARLDPRTVAVLDSCLSRIDRAIVEARSALRQDPGNDIVIRLLTATYQQKLDLLRRTASLPQGSL